MKGRKVTFLFLNIIALVFQHPAPQNDLTIGVNAVDKALQVLGITGSSRNWEVAFAQLAERFLQKDDAIRKLLVLNFIRTHMESFSLQTDPPHYTMKKTSTPLITMNWADIPIEDIPSSFQGRLEAHFKTAYILWYRIIMNSKDRLIVALVDALKTELLGLERPLTEKDIAKNLAVIWCTVCNDIHLILGSAKGQILWKNADEVAHAFAAFQEDGFYVDFVRIFMKVTKFRERFSVNKTG